MTGLLEDLKHALRIYRRTPLSSAIAVLALGLAISGVTASFSLLSDLTLKPHPGFERGSRLLTAGQTNGTRFDPLSLNLTERIAQEAVTLDGAVGVHEATLTWHPAGASQRVKVELVTGGYFPVLKPRLLLGRGFSAGDHQSGAAPAAILSYRFWQREFGGNTDVLGRTIKLTGGPEGVKLGPDGKMETPVEGSGVYHIIGVFAGQVRGTFASDTEVWVPYEQAGPIFVVGGDLFRPHQALKVVARLRDGANESNARTELQSKYRDGDTSLGTPASGRLDVLGGVVSDIGAQRVARQQVRLLVGGCVLLVIVAASNISLFLLSQAPRRQRELGIRMAVGAPAGRLARQLTTEAALVVTLAAIVGLIVSLWLTGFMQNLALLRDAEWNSATPLDWRVLLMVLAVTFVLSALVSLAPVIGVKRSGLASTTRMVSARPRVTQRLAGTAQIAVASVLAGVAVAFIWYLVMLGQAERGFVSEGVFVVDPEPPDPSKMFSLKPAEVFATRARQREAIVGLPGVSGVTFGSSVPGQVAQFTALGRPPGVTTGDPIKIIVVSADSDYPAVLGMSLEHGRRLASGELGAVVINETLARQLWARTNVVGEVLPVPFLKFQVVGVLRDAVYFHPAQATPAMVFVAVAPISVRDSMIVRTSATGDELRRQLQSRIDAGTLELKIASIRPLNVVWGAVLAPDRARTELAGGSACLVVLLSVFGFYGTQRYLVNAGRREYAIRSAIGAGPRSLFQLVIQRGLLLGLPGLLIGAVLTTLVISWLRDDYFSAKQSPALIAVAVALAVAVLIVAATLGPARQAASTDPAPLLRED